MKKRQTRREFLAESSTVAVAVSALSLGLVACNTASGPDESSGASVTIDVSQSEYSALAGTGGAVKIDVEGQPKKVIVVRKSASEVKAFSSECPHAGCAVELPDATGTVRCPCHGSSFNQDGALLTGPAVSNLAPLTASVEGDIITVTS